MGGLSALAIQRVDRAKPGLWSGTKHLGASLEVVGGANVSADNIDVAVPGELGDLLLVVAVATSFRDAAGAQAVPARNSGSSPTSWARFLTISATSRSDSRSRVSWHLVDAHE